MAQGQTSISVRAALSTCTLLSLGTSLLRCSHSQRDRPGCAPCGCDPLAIACKGAMTQRAVRCPSVRVLPGNGRGLVLGAGLVAARLGDAMEQDVPLGTAVVQSAGWFASIQGWEWFLSRCWQERSHVRDMFPVQRGDELLPWW